MKAVLIFTLIFFPFKTLANFHKKLLPAEPGYQQNIELLQKAMDTGANLTRIKPLLEPQKNAINSYGENVLFYVANNSHLEMISFLVKDLKLDVNSTNIHGETPLMRIIWLGNPKITELLLKLGADVLKTTTSGESAVYLAYDKYLSTKNPNQLENIKLLEKAEEKAKKRKEAQSSDKDLKTYTPEERAVIKEDIEQLKSFLEEGKINSESTLLERNPMYKNSLLTEASKWNNPEFVSLLVLKFNFDVNLRNKYGRTPLHLATERGHGEVVLELLKLGADPFIEDAFKNKPLDLAIHKNHKDLIRVLRPATRKAQNAAYIKEYSRVPLLKPFFFIHKQCADIFRSKQIDQ